MKTLSTLAGIFISLGLIGFSNGEEIEPFYSGENAVGYIKDNKGNKYIVIEMPDGRAKLVKTRKNPEEILQDGYGISNKDFQIR